MHYSCTRMATVGVKRLAYHRMHATTHGHARQHVQYEIHNGETKSTAEIFYSSLLQITQRPLVLHHCLLCQCNALLAVCWSPAVSSSYHDIINEKSLPRFPLFYRQKTQDFPGPVWNPQMFKYKEKNGIYLQYSQCTM